MLNKLAECLFDQVVSYNDFSEHKTCFHINQEIHNHYLHKATRVVATLTFTVGLQTLEPIVKSRLVQVVCATITLSEKFISPFFIEHIQSFKYLTGLKFMLLDLVQQPKKYFYNVDMWGDVLLSRITRVSFINEDRKLVFGQVMGTFLNSFPNLDSLSFTACDIWFPIKPDIKRIYLDNSHWNCIFAGAESLEILNCKNNLDKIQTDSIQDLTISFSHQCYDDENVLFPRTLHRLKLLNPVQRWFFKFDFSTLSKLCISFSPHDAWTYQELLPNLQIKLPLLQDFHLIGLTYLLRIRIQTKFILHPISSNVYSIHTKARGGVLHSRQLGDVDVLGHYRPFDPLQQWKIEHLDGNLTTIVNVGTGQSLLTKEDHFRVLKFNQAMYLIQSRSGKFVEFSLDGIVLANKHPHDWNLLGLDLKDQEKYARDFARLLFEEIPQLCKTTLQWSSWSTELHFNRSLIKFRN